MPNWPWLQVNIVRENNGKNFFGTFSTMHVPPKSK